MAANSYLVIVMLFLLTMSGCAKAPKPDGPKDQLNLKTAAEASTSALLRRDFATVADYTYDPLVEIIGGKEEVVFTLEGQLKDLDDKGMAIVSINVGEPGPVNNIENLQFSVVPTTIKLKYKDASLVSESFVLGVSNDGGKRWKFVDGAVSDNQEVMKELFPNAADKLQLPPIKEPVISDDK